MKEGLTFLIIDDDTDIQTFLKLFLQKRGFRTFQAYALKDAMTKIKMVRPDFILVDNHLPDGLGIELIPQFRALAQNAVIIAMTAMTPEQSRKEAFYNGADHFLEKPFSLHLISGLINEALQNSTPNQLN